MEEASRGQRRMGASSDGGPGPRRGCSNIDGWKETREQDGQGLCSTVINNKLREIFLHGDPKGVYEKIILKRISFLAVQVIFICVYITNYLHFFTMFLSF